MHECVGNLEIVCYDEPQNGPQTVTMDPKMSPKRWLMVPKMSPKNLIGVTITISDRFFYDQRFYIISQN